jgi:4-amino-4-deoxy-L-arabinose transferase-like glycosyltransferase
MVQAPLSDGAPAAGSRFTRWPLAVLILAAFAVPLMAGLDRWDLRNDEAIYAFSVDRMLDTGDWLTPRLIPTDHAFLEKPPMKLWLVAGAMAAGVVPHNEAGMRSVDALFGVIAFAYMLAFAWRLGGPLAAALTLLVAVTFDPLLDYGVRAHHMDGTLVLCYAAGLWHALKWRETAESRTRRAHAAALVGWFTLGFMTKFVAIFFLPVIALLWVMTTRGGARRLWSNRADWITPAALALVAVLPWFVYESYAHGRLFWDVLLLQHVVARLTGVLHVEHIQPWHYYVVQIWQAWMRAEGLPLVIAGAALCVWRAWQGHALAQLLLLWFLIPTTIISAGTSKLITYVLPFVPPLAIAAGWAGAEAFQVLSRWLTSGSINIRTGLPRVANWLDERPATRRALLLVAAGSVVIAVLNLATGEPVTLRIGDRQAFRSSSAARVVVLAAVLLTLARAPRAAGHVLAAYLMSFVVPYGMYGMRLDRSLSIDHPLRAASECMSGNIDAGRAPSAGLLVTEPAVMGHPPFYYLRHLGTWQWGTSDWRAETARALVERRPVIVTESQWREAQVAGNGLALDGTAVPEVRAVYAQQDALLLLPGAHGSCESAIVAAGGRAFEPDAR